MLSIIALESSTESKCINKFLFVFENKRVSIGCNNHKIVIAIAVVANPAQYIPPPTAKPIAATVHKPEAVVNPRIIQCRKNIIVPALKTPITLTTLKATLQEPNETFDYLFNSS